MMWRLGSGRASCKRCLWHRRAGVSRLGSWLRLLALVWLAAARSHAHEGRLEVVVSVGPLAQLVERLGETEVRVTALLPPGAAPEAWSPMPREALALARAELYVAVGHPALVIESRYLEPLARQSRHLHRVSLTRARVDAGSDPHLWMDLDLMAETAGEIAAWLGEQLPGSRSRISGRLDRLRRDIDRIDARMKWRLASGRRPVVVQHPAWERLLERYGVESMVIEEDGKEPAPLALTKLIERARELGVSAVFTQSGVSDRGARLVASEIGARLVELDPLATDWLENLERAVEAFALAAE